MNNEHCDQLVDYLNGTLSAEENRQFEEHLKTCDECREIADATGQLPYLSDPAEPPAGMKSRILSNVFAEESESADPADSGTIDGEPENRSSHSASSASSASSAAAGAAVGNRASSASHAESETSDRKPRNDERTNVVPMTGRGRKRNWVTPLIAAVLLVSLLGNVFAYMQLQEEPEQAAPEPAPTPPETAFQSVDLQPSEGFGGDATAAVIEEENGALNLVVTAEQLAALEGDQVYQVWLIEGDNPIPAGAFTTNADGEGATYFNIDNSTEEWDTIAITLEPQAGNELPQGEVVLSAGI
ncbi:anti-sigma factor [Planomicrobium okeanokoites]|uniref:Anti-sigma-W factor RsiW n=1 Tax=Planomicrobium okeanokoites TaxID=244 RepID=A0ABV7KRN5_PLAOK|nr:anti-sigma factor [Planomicrobium okeanokoites]